MNFSEGLGALSEVLEQIGKASIHIDLDQVMLNKTLSTRLSEIESELDFQVQGNELDLINSRFIHEPFEKIEKCL